MWARAELKNRCKQVMKRNYWMMFLVAFIGILLTKGFGNNAANAGSEAVRGGMDGAHITMDTLTYFFDVPFHMGVLENTILVSTAILILIIGILLTLVYSIFIANPLKVGMARYFVKNVEENQKVSVLFSVFSSDYLNIVKIMFLMNLKTFLWTLLFVIPGIVKSYEYQMIPYLLAEDPGMSSEEAFARTRAMTKGQKFEIFILDLSFLGWRILGNFLIIGNLFVNPYVEGTNAELYLELYARCEQDSYEDTYL